MLAKLARLVDDEHDLELATWLRGLDLDQKRRDKDHGALPLLPKIDAIEGDALASKLLDRLVVEIF